MTTNEIGLLIWGMLMTWAVCNLQTRLKRIERERAAQARAQQEMDMVHPFLSRGGGLL